MEDPGITRLNIDHYRRLLKTSLDDTRREQTVTLLAEAEARLSARPHREQWEHTLPSIPSAAKVDENNDAGD